MPVIQKEKYFSAYTYHEYFEFVKAQVDSPSTEVYAKYKGYIQQNIARMKRLERKEMGNLFLMEKIAGKKDKINILVISEPWCGDAAQSVPIIFNAFKNHPNYTLRVFLRDNSEYLMNQFLTEGSKSIPIVAFLDENMELLFKWGPRPIPVQALYKSLLMNKNLDYDEISYQLHSWYAKDKGITLENELYQLF